MAERRWQQQRERPRSLPLEALRIPALRPKQQPPAGDWFIWLVLAGRGWGKTLTGAHFIAMAALRDTGPYALVGSRFAAARDVMLEGPSGLLHILPPSSLRGGSMDSAYNRSMGELYLENGAKFKAYSSERPGSLRGPQHKLAWGDEPAEWMDAERGTSEDTTYSNLLMGLRLGEAPRLVLTGTPKPRRLIRELLAAPGVVTTRGSTYENLENLASTFRSQVVDRYAGTRLGRQELEAELLTDTPGALWNWNMFEREGFRLLEAPPLERVVVGVDPAASADGAATGIVVAGRGRDGRFYVLGDYSLMGSPHEWAARVFQSFDAYRADRIVPERNNGGDMVEATLRTLRRNAPIRPVWASRGKLTRAEPIAALYEQGRVSHVGRLDELEAQLTGWVPGQASPDRLDALVWAMTELSAQPAQPKPHRPTATATRAVTAPSGSFRR